MGKVIILITIDCLRYDSLEYLLKSIPKSYGIKVYHNHYSNAPYTWLSFPSIFTSTPPIFIERDSVFKRMVITQLLKRYLNKLITIGVNGGNPFLVKQRGYAKGFDHFIDLTDNNNNQNFFRDLFKYGIKKVINKFLSKHNPLRTLLAILIQSYLVSIDYMVNANQQDKVISLLFPCINILNKNIDIDTNYFIWIHLMNLHTMGIFRMGHMKQYCGLLNSSLILARTYFRGTSGTFTDEDVKETRNVYFKELQLVSSTINNLLRLLLEILREHEVYIIITSDHGEEFLEHGGWGHQGRAHYGIWITHLYDELLHVPFIIASPYFEKRIEHYYTITSHLDVLPTIMHLFLNSNIVRTIYRMIWGSSLLSLEHYCRIERESYDRARIVVAEADAIVKPNLEGLGQAYAIIDKRYKYIWHPVLGEALFDRMRDPTEKVNLIDDLQDLANEYRRHMVKYLRTKRRRMLSYKAALKILEL